MNIIDKKDINFDKLSIYKCPANSESKLFYDKHNMYKMFNDTNNIYLLRKKLKLEILSDGEKIDSAVLPDSIIMSDRSLSGYAMKRISDGVPIFDFTSKNRNVNLFLNMMNNVSLSLRNIHLDPRNIVIGDLSISNIIFDKNMKHYFIDFDSVMIDKIIADRVPYSLDRYAKRCGIYKYDINKNTDRLCLILSTLFILFSKSIEEVSKKEYDEKAEKIETLKNMREIVLEIKKYNNIIPELPYIDELIITNKKKIKTINTKNIR